MFPAPDWPLENVATWNIFLRDLRFLFLVTGNRDRKFRYCSRIYVRNWFTLLNEQNPLLDFEGTRFVNERSLFWFFFFKSPYLSTHRWNGGSGAGNEHIFQSGPRYHFLFFLASIHIFFLQYCKGYFRTRYQFIITVVLKFKIFKTYTIVIIGNVIICWRHVRLSILKISLREIKEKT